MPELFTSRVNCTAFVIIFKHFTLTYLGSCGELSPLAPDKLRPRVYCLQPGASARESYL